MSLGRLSASDKIELRVGKKPGRERRGKNLLFVRTFDWFSIEISCIKGEISFNLLT